MGEKHNYFDFLKSWEQAFSNSETGFLVLAFFTIAFVITIGSGALVYFCFKDKLKQPVVATLTMFLLSPLLSVLCYFILNAIGTYNLGWTAVLIAPFLNGFLTCLLFAMFAESSEVEITRTYTTLVTVLLLPFLLTTVQIGTLCIFLLEGTICIIMAAPLLYGAAIFGAGAAYLILLLADHRIIKGKPKMMVATVIIGLILVTASQWVESNIFTRTVNSSKTTILTVNAPVETVFKNIKAYPVIQNPNEVNELVDLLFVLGLPAPTQSTFNCATPGRCDRECRFTQNIVLKEKVTKLIENKELSFDVVSVVGEQNRLTGVDVHIMPGGAYFDNQKGQFLLKNLGPRKTQIIGTTWYKLHSSMPDYAKPWTDYMLQGIHSKVMNQIKKVSEASS